VGTVWVPVTCPVCKETEAMEEEMWEAGKRMVCTRCRKVMELDLRELGGEG